MRNNGIHIRVGDMLYGMIKHRVLIIALTAAGLLVGIVLSGISYLRGEMSREYVVTSSFTVNTQTQSGLFTSGYDFPGYNDINMAERLADAVSYILKSDKMLNEIIDSLGLLGITTKDIADNLSLTQYNETQILEMSLYWRSSEEGIRILSEINEKAPDVLAETLSIGTISVINEPSARYLIGGRINIVLWGYTALLGLGLGIGITLLELLMHPTLLNVSDLETVYGLEVLCEIADDKAYFNGRSSVLVKDDAHSETAESFASAAHIMQARLRHGEKPHIIYVTSALRGEGKTKILSSLAIHLSDLEKKVLMIDFDMKNPTLSQVFLKKSSYEHSLNALYAGDITETEAIVPLTGYLDLLPTVLERSSIPLDSNLFGVVKKIAASYDYVLIDTAPVGLTADPMSLNQIASAAIFVVRYDTASMQEIKDALERIEKSGVSIMGCVVNGIQVSEKGIKNPVKEREKLKREEQKAEQTTEPLTHLDEDNMNVGSADDADENLRSLVAGFVADGDASKSETYPDVTTEEHFVKLLFREEENREAAAEESSEEEPGHETDVEEKDGE